MSKPNRPKKVPDDQEIQPVKSYRVLILTFILMGVVGYAFGKHPDLFFTPSHQTFKTAQLELAPGVVSVPPLKMEAALAAGYRLKPDNRFLLAVDKMVQLITGNSGKAEARFEKGIWTIFHNGEFVGKLPEIPDLKDFLKILKHYARVLSDRDSTFIKNGTALAPGFKFKSTQALESFQPKIVAQHLREIDSLVKKGTRRSDLLVPSAKALSILSFNHLDTLEVADDVPAQALAVLAAAQVFSGELLVKEEARLAEEMGYATHAQELVRQLKVSDPLRQYILHDTPALKALAVKRTSDWETRFLYLLRLAKSKNNSVWEQWYDEGFPLEYEDTLALFKTGLILDSFSDNNYYARNVRQLIFKTLKLEIEGPATQSAVGEFFDEILSLSEIAQIFSSLQEMSEEALEISELESDLSELEDIYTGPFLDAATYQSFFRGLFYSSLYTNGRQYLDRISSLQDAEQFLLDTGTSASGDSEETRLGANFHQWFSFLIQSSRRTVQPMQVLHMSEGMPLLKGEPVHKAYEEARQFIPYGSPIKLRVLKRLFARMDTRVSHLEHVRWLALEDLMDLGMSEHLARSMYTAGRGLFPYQESWYLKFIGDSKTLLKNLRSGKGSVKSRVWILGFLEDIKTLKDRTLIREYRKLIQEDPENWLVRQPFVKFLIRKKHYKEARKHCLDWLEKDVEVSGLEKVAAHNFVAEAFLKEKKYLKAYEEISKVVRGYQGKSLRLAGQIMDKLGEQGKAESIFRKAIQRYPGSYKQTQSLINFLWSQKRYDEVLKLIKEFPGGLKMENWRSDLAIGFYNTFKDRPDDEAIAAFESLLNGGIQSSYLRYIPGTLHNGEHSRLAFKLQSRLKGKKSQQLFFEIKAYKFLKAWKGRRAAYKWLKARNPGQYGIHSANVFFERKNFPMLWDLIPPNPEPQVWLLRAAASLRSRPTATQRRQLQKYFRKNDPSSTRNQMGRYLLGKISEEDLLEQANDPVKRLESAFYIAWKARAKGDWYKAARWFRIAIETGEKKHWEYGWAGNHLFKWKDRGFALSYLKKHPELL